MLRKNWLLIGLVIIVLIVGVAADIFFWKHIAADAEQQQVRLKTSTEALSAQIAQQQAELTALQNKLSQFMRTTQQSNVQQTLNEVGYLLDVANLYLQINHDPVNAAKSLQLAHHHLQMLGDPTLLPLQQALASDLNHLKDTQPVNMAEVLLKLQTLSESISRLTMVPRQITPHPAVSPPEPMPVSQPWYQRFWEGFKATFKNLVVIRYHSTASSPILPPEQRDWIRENMAFTLSLAQWAALREQPQLYKHSLEQVRQGLIANYPDNAERKKILDRVAELMAIDIAPTPPDINASLRAVQQALKELPPEPAAPSVNQPTLPQTESPPTAPALPPEKTPPPATGVEI
jgi:uroporphyrin-III C-methyltransferase